MKIKMQLLSDTIFGSGISVPGGEDISVLCDKDGFPYYKGGTFKGVFREELERYLEWTVEDTGERKEIMNRLLGKTGNISEFDESKLIFSDFTLSDYVKEKVLEELGSAERHENMITNLMTHTRTLTAIDESGLVSDGSMRSLRCVNQGLYFYSSILCSEEDEELIRNILSMIKWIGSMRNRGFGKVKITVEE